MGAERGQAPRKQPENLHFSPTPGAASGVTVALGLAARSGLAFAVGVVVSVGCASSDAMLEKKRRRQAIEGGGIACRPDLECYTGDKTTRGRGSCRPGQTVCTEDGNLESCQGEVLPVAESCNRADDDCDGIVDNGFERDGALCFFADAKGACATQGKWHCSEDGTKSTCDAQIIKPTPETCDGVDNDCDGETDEDSIPEAELQCTTGKAGVCNAGTVKCVNASPTCIQDVKPGPEICNKKDDNCNNMVDEDCVSAEAAKKQQE